MGIESQAILTAWVKNSSPKRKCLLCYQLRPVWAVYSGGVDVTECVNAWLASTGKSQVAVARAAGMNAGKLNEIVKGKTARGKRPDPQFSTVEKIAKGFGISVLALLEGPRPEDDTGHAQRSVQTHSGLQRLLDAVDAEFPAEDSWQGDIHKAVAALNRALRRGRDSGAPHSKAAKA